MTDRGLEVEFRAFRVSPPEGDLAEMKPRLRKVLPGFECPPESGFRSRQIIPPERRETEEVVGAAQLRIQRDRLFEKSRRAFMISLAPGEVAELEQRPRIAGRKLPVPLESEAGRREPLLAEKRRPEIGEHPRIAPIAEPDRLLQFVLGFRPLLHPQQQPAEEAAERGILWCDPDRRPGLGKGFFESAGGIERRRRQIPRLHPRRRKTSRGPKRLKRRFRLAELAERLPQREPGIHEAGIQLGRGPEVGDRPRRLSAHQPEDTRLLKGGRVGFPPREKVADRSCRAVGIARFESFRCPSDLRGLETPAEKQGEEQKKSHESESPLMFPRLGPVVLFLGLAAACAPPPEQAPVLPVGGDIARPERIRFEPPKYPEAAEARGEEALVILELTLAPSGEVNTARSLRGPDELAAAAVRAAERWAYEPTLVDGAPVGLRFAETVRFVLRPAGGFGMRLPPTAARADLVFPEWRIEGHAFTACPCDTPCPCRSNAPPSHPPCHATTATRLESGRYGTTDLAGAEFITLGPETWVALYLDQDLDREQEQAILGIFRSLAPGAPQRYRAVRRVPLAITSIRRASAVLQRAVIPGILEMETRIPLSAEGGLAGLLPGMDVWSNRIAYGRTGTYRFADPELPAAWDHSGRQSNGKEFTLDLGMYREGRMLIQHGDGSGDWTERQRALFTCSLVAPNP